MRALMALIAGLIFGLGLIVSGMSDPSKVLAFLDLAGTWDPSLAFVMGGRDRSLHNRVCAGGEAR